MRRPPFECVEQMRYGFGVCTFWRKPVNNLLCVLLVPSLMITDVIPELKLVFLGFP
jgi:hypothetical protein